MLNVVQPVVMEAARLGFPWATVDPFLFCAYHNDAFPRGNGSLGPDTSLLAGRQLGMDFEVKDGFRMYHGLTVPGFPSHPHRGFETVTLVRKGYCDHSDSLGAAARFGSGDVQWITTGSGIVHAEMFPLLSEEQDNPLELFQIWLNLPKNEKMVPAHFSMLWNHQIPVVTCGEPGAVARVKVVAGTLRGQSAPAPPPHSWAARKQSDVAIWTIELEPGATCCLPPAAPGSHRALYYFEGSGAGVAAVGQEHCESGPASQVPRALESLRAGHVHLVRPDTSLWLTTGAEASQFLLLQGKPIGQPVAQHGPFVMNTQAEIQAAFRDYQQTRFGGWPWPSDDPVHPKDAGRFAVHVDGRREEYPR